MFNVLFAAVPALNKMLELSSNTALATVLCTAMAKAPEYAEVDDSLAAAVAEALANVLKKLAIPKLLKSMAFKMFKLPAPSTLS